MITPPSHGIRSLDRGFSWTQQPLIAISPSFLPLLFSLDRSPIPSSFVLSFFSPFPSLSSCFICIRRLNDTSSLSRCFFFLFFFFFFSFSSFLSYDSRFDVRASLPRYSNLARHLLHFSLFLFPSPGFFTLPSSKYGGNSDKKFEFCLFRFGKMILILISSIEYILKKNI